MAEAQDEIRAVLRRRRHVPYSAPENFGLSTATEVAAQFKQITGSVALLTAVVSSIGLLVGGVGVMNIMLMSVTQRTREIGVRKSDWSSPQRRHLAIPDRGHRPHRLGRRHRRHTGHWHQSIHQPVSAQTALCGSGLGCWSWLS